MRCECGLHRAMGLLRGHALTMRAIKAATASTPRGQRSTTRSTSVRAAPALRHARISGAGIPAAGRGGSGGGGGDPCDDCLYSSCASEIGACEANADCVAIEGLFRRLLGRRLLPGLLQPASGGRYVGRRHLRVRLRRVLAAMHRLGLLLRNPYRGGTAEPRPGGNEHAWLSFVTVRTVPISARPSTRKSAHRTPIEGSFPMTSA